MSLVVHKPAWLLGPKDRDSMESTLGGALSAVRAQCNYLGVWPY